VALVLVSPATDTIAVGDTTSFNASLRNCNGDPIVGPTVVWTVSDSSVARLESTAGYLATVRGLTAGFSLVTATSEGKSGSAQLVVR
jgi:uncharacterized protein YjdB